MMIDAHCHYDMFDNPLQIINECEKLRIVTIGMTNLPSHFEMGYPHIKRFKYIRLGLGLHPLMAQNHSRELLKFKNNINNTSYIGEIGLDFSKEGIETKDIQLNSFEYVLETIKGKRKILSIHSRKAEKEVLELLKKHQIELAIFHWYSGGISVLKAIIEQGFLLSINPSMVQSKSGQRIISEIPLDKVLTETDSPYALVNGKKTKPKDVKLVIDYLSNYHKITAESVEKKVYENFKKLVDRIR
jgi:TatD DNase family protein